MVANRLHPRTITKKFKQACKSVGFDNFRFHDLRHSFCQNLAMTTGDSAYLKAKMRHSSIGTTENYLKDDRFNWTKIVETERYEG